MRSPAEQSAVCVCVRRLNPKHTCRHTLDDTTLHCIALHMYIRTYVHMYIRTYIPTVGAGVSQLGPWGLGAESPVEAIPGFRV